MRLHIGELVPQGGHAAVKQRLGDRFEEGVAHACAGAVRQHVAETGGRWGSREHEEAGSARENPGNVHAAGIFLAPAQGLLDRKRVPV